MKSRLKTTITPLALCSLAGGIYYIWLSFTNVSIPCLFYLWTGFKCPGCGITRMCVAVLTGKMNEAREANLLLFYLLPVLIIGQIGIDGYYVLTGKRCNQKYIDIIASVAIVLLFVFGVYRNIVGC